MEATIAGFIYLHFFTWGFYTANLDTGCYHKATYQSENVMYVEANCNTNYYIINGEYSEDNTSKINIEVK